MKYLKEPFKNQDCSIPGSYVTDPGNNDSLMKITHITTKGAKGIFSGTLFNLGTRDLLTITDGSFPFKLDYHY